MINELKEQDDFIMIGPVSAEDIREAEVQLGLTFAEEYKEYLEQCGVASANGHEFTGLVNSKRLNVVSVTLAEKEKNPSVGDDFYVIENLGIDKIITWQDSNGNLYQTVDTGNPKKLSMSFAEYLE